MSIIRVSKQENYSILSNGFINDATLSYREVGMLTFLLSKPNHWEVNVTNLFNSHEDGRDAVYAILKSLREKGYITLDQKTKGNGTFAGSSYTVREEPVQTSAPQIDPPPATKPSRQPSAPTTPTAATMIATGKITALRIEDLNAVIRAYPIHRVPAGALEHLASVWNEMVATYAIPILPALLDDIKARKESYDWTKEGGRWVPNLLKYLQERMWLHPILPGPPKTLADWNEGGRGVLVQ